MNNYDTKKLITDFLSTCNESVSLFKLKQALLEYKIPDEHIEADLEKMLAEEMVLYTSRGISLQLQSIHNKIEKIPDEKERFALIEYFKGNKSADYTSQELKLIVEDLLKAPPNLAEDSYREIFQKYRFDRNSFTTVFEQPLSTYIYLQETCKKGSIDWRELRFDSSCNKEIKGAVIDYLKIAGLKENGHRIPCSVEGISLYLLENFKHTISIKELFLEYSDLISKRSPLPSELDVSFNRFLNLLNSSHKTIIGQAMAVRYRPSTEKMDRKFLKNLKISQYRNQYLSAEVIFKDASDNMKTANIQSPAELINLMKAYPDICERHKITFSKTPFLSIGNGDAEKQLKNLLKELSPVSSNKLANEYEKRYGIKANTVKASLLKNISHYLKNGVYDTEIKGITDKQFDKLIGQLEAPWYYITEVEQLFKKRIGKLYQNYMSTKNLALLGYRNTSSVIYASKYNSLEECLDKTSWKGNTFSIEDELWEIQQVYRALQKKAANFDIVEYFPQKFIRISYLKKKGIHKKDLNAFISVINSQVSDEMYFTLHSLRECGIVLLLEDLGFDDMFYYSILKQSKRIQARRVAGTYLFRKSKNDATLPDFIEYILTELRSVDLYDLTELLMEKYGIALAPSYIRSISSNTQMYYDAISEKLFLDYDEYFEEV